MPSKDSDHPVHLSSLIRIVTAYFGWPRMQNFFMLTMKTDSDWTDVQAVLSLYWVHMLKLEGTFSHVYCICRLL